VLGAAYLIESGSFAAEFPRLFTREDEPTEVAEVGSGVGGEFAAGLSGIVLGILALLTSMSAMRVRHLGLQATVAGVVGHNVQDEAVTFTAWLSAVCGLGAIVLGIVSLVLMTTEPIALPITLSLIAFLALGFATVISGSSVARQMVHLYRPAH
jgi:hypothetical protein